MTIKSSKLKIQSYSLKLKVIYKVINFALCIAILHFALCTLHLTEAHAEGLALKVQPTTLQIRSKPPSDIHVPFTLTNQSDDSIDVSIILKRFEASEEEDGQLVYLKPDLIDEKQKDTFLQNVLIIDNDFSLDSLTLSPKQEKQLELRIILPKDAKLEDHYFSVVFLTKPKETFDTESKETISQVQLGVNMPVLLAVGEDKASSMAIDEYLAPIFLQTGPVPFSLKVQNHGNHFISPRGLILIKNMFGQTVGRVEIPTTNILATTSRYLTNDSGIMSQKVVWSEKFLLGFYTATLSLVDDQNELLYSRSIHFIAMPFIFLGFAFLTLVLLILFIRRLRNRLSKE